MTSNAPGYDTPREIVKSVWEPLAVKYSAGMIVLVVTAAALLAASFAQYFAEREVPVTGDDIFSAQSEASVAWAVAVPALAALLFALLALAVALVAAFVALVAAAVWLAEEAVWDAEAALADDAAACA